MTEKEVNPMEELERREAFKDLTLAPLKAVERIVDELEMFKSYIERKSVVLMTKIDDPTANVDETRHEFADYCLGVKSFSDEIRDYSEYLKQVQKQIDNRR